MVFKYCLKLDLSLRRGKGILFSFQSTYVGIIFLPGDDLKGFAHLLKLPLQVKTHTFPRSPLFSASNQHVSPAHFILATGHQGGRLTSMIC
ncbi:hypothetical protein BDV35DRAFT_345786 [Aspergillus flavus]|uniref:Uncharacterized protein n=1 Tax=Aspergillus flavus TaxID=5059 RepID=A0A5N6H4E3_ASPFL|nr:hypothetical protein BDV35DRAFT_345786 [Aspergillus flavus]